jgi:hypothetical protein
MIKDAVSLTMAKNLDLINLIKSEYEDTCMNDIQFAKYASDKLGVDVNSNHIAKRRYEFNIPSNVVRSVPVTDEVTKDIENRLHALECAVATIIRRMDNIYN